MNRKKREQLIFDAALQVFSRKGYQRSSVSEIIQEAKVARGTFYLYFKSKQVLFDALLERFMITISNDVKKIISQKKDPRLGTEQNIRRLSGDLIQTLTSYKLLLKFLFIDSQQLDGHINAKVSAFTDQLADIIRHHLNKEVEQGSVRALQTRIAAQCMIGSVKEILTQWILSDGMDIERTIQGVIDYLLHGLITPNTLDGHTTTDKSKENIPRIHSNLH